MKLRTVLHETKDRIATITLNRHECFNPINETMPEDLASDFNYVSNDNSVHVVVITGAEKVGFKNAIT